MTRIKVMLPHEQQRMLSDYIISVMADQFSDSFKLIHKISIQGQESSLNVLEKALYFGL
ncbi:MAG: hypothetical protein NUK65_01990 [Firmicutes bacterium]|nr:hypothetical protein [Bacillota bacterium]